MADAAEPAEQPYLYDAFISYRHVDRDRKWAEWLMAALEGYRVPKARARWVVHYGDDSSAQMVEIFRANGALLRDNVLRREASGNKMILSCDPQGAARPYGLDARAVYCPP